VRVPNKDRKPLTKNQKIICLIFIISGALFLLNEITWRIDQEREYKETVKRLEEERRNYCESQKEILAPDVYQSSTVCQEYERSLKKQQNK